MKKFVTAVALAVGSWVGVAQAAPVITFTAGGSGSPTGQMVVQNFDSYTSGASLGKGAYVYTASQPGIADRPTGASGNYAAVTAGGQLDVNFSQATGLFSFVLGTLDAYNRLVVHYAGGADQTLDGTAIIGGLGGLMSEGLVSYSANGGPLFTGVSFLSTTQNSFEVDTISAAVPEPAAWGMMILGFGLAGFALRRRSSVKVRFA